MRWFDVKYGGNEDWHDWIKMHLMCATTTHIVASVELSPARTHDAPYFKPLVEQAARAGFNMKEISADKGYISADQFADRSRPRRDALHSIQNERDRQVWLRALEKAVSLLQLQARRVFSSLSQTIQRGNHVQHDQGEIWRAVEKQDRDGASK